MIQLPIYRNLRPFFVKLKFVKLIYPTLPPADLQTLPPFLICLHFGLADITQNLEETHFLYEETQRSLVDLEVPKMPLVAKVW